MKKSIFSIIFLAVLVLPAFSQQNKLPRIEEVRGNMPEWAKSTPPENELWGIGVGDLSTAEASMEQAKFNAHTLLCLQLSHITIIADNSMSNVPQNIIDRLDFYQNLYYEMVSIESYQQACFELYGLTKVERRARTSDGKIWYLVSLKKGSATKIAGLSEYIHNYINSNIEDFEESSP